MGVMLGRSNLIDDIDLNALIVEDYSSSTPVECNLPNGVESDSLVFHFSFTVVSADFFCLDWFLFGQMAVIHLLEVVVLLQMPMRTIHLFQVLMFSSNQELVGHSVYSLEEAFDMYNDLASRMGFSVRKGKQYYFPGTRNVKSKKFHCYKAGLKAKQASANKCYTKIDTRTGCDAMCQFDLGSSGKWVVTKHVKEHNHELCPASASYMLRSHRNVSVDQLTYLKDMKRSGVPLSDGIRFLKHQSRGSPFVGFTARDAYNTMLLDSAKHLDGIDSNTLIEIFRKRQLNESGFFFDFEVDNDARYDCMNVMFGCGFLLNERTESFVWLFKTFLQSMDGRQPQTIMTDQCSAMAAAIMQVFPNSKHRLCIWHIGENSKKHIKGLRMQKGFIELFNFLLKYSDTEAEFEFYWNSVISKWRSRESGEDVRCFQGLPSMAMNYVKLLSHAREVYTIEIYFLFEEQFLKGSSCHQDLVGVSGEVMKYHVWRPDVDLIRHEVCFSVKDLDISCSCRLFSEMGILCSHSLRILNIHCVATIPDKYILKRWTKRVIEDMTVENVCGVTSSGWVIQIGRKFQRLVLSSQDNSKAREACEDAFQNSKMKIEAKIGPIFFEDGEQTTDGVIQNLSRSRPKGERNKRLISTIEKKYKYARGRMNYSKYVELNTKAAVKSSVRESVSSMVGSGYLVHPSSGSSSKLVHFNPNEST
ncbi:protein FAR1-RELATED SEQUENCE 3-like [Ipomoea triloba]|uniref:protein FAR1-RELATED SEQUENCE 3-like n=1 Tax=Ipomoea triloba TaxID=35885 RepID=UPI00125DB639|nr:protein FAR1-RELATED SEQUENCE 3-like [Ipomoea triloba]